MRALTVDMHVHMSAVEAVPGKAPERVLGDGAVLPAPSGTGAGPTP